jgi:hypothetical protein
MVGDDDPGGGAVNDDETLAADREGARGTGEDATGTVMDLLAEHVPLTLLADLAAAEPRSEAILQAEGLPEDAWWEGDDARTPAGADDAGAPEDELPADPDAAAGTSSE